MELETKIIEILHRLGISPLLLGYSYLKEAIKLSYKDNTYYLKNITKRLYPDIAKKFKTILSRVERAIRHTIECAYKNGDDKFMNELCSYITNNKSGKMSNGNFIAIIVEKISYS